MGNAEQKKETQFENLKHYHLLGRSGLRVSSLCLGTMTFGNEKWGHDQATSADIFSAYLQAGGNFIDTADRYAAGASEEILGRLIAENSCRERVVLASKFHFTHDASDPNAGGNSRKHIRAAIEGSLKRLRTDYLDLYWMHAWDGLTPPEEVVQTLHSLIEQGKIRYYGFSDTPAWYVGKVCGLTQGSLHVQPIALQLEYSLAVRDIEFEFTTAAQELGLGICSWSPLAGGMLTGKYKRGEKNAGRLETMKDSPNPVFDKFSDKNFSIVDTLLEVAGEIGRSPAEVALNWITKRPGVASTIIGATNLKQLESNLSALDFELPDALARRLDDVSRPAPMMPYIFYQGTLRRMGNGDNPVRKEAPWFRRVD
jgi:aryl-alcohol dehydrogenase-like predicted oxidoreductase